jgi:hypothetical protein
MAFLRLTGLYFGKFIRTFIFVRPQKSIARLVLEKSVCVCVTTREVDRCWERGKAMNLHSLGGPHVRVQRRLASKTLMTFQKSKRIFVPHFSHGKIGRVKYPQLEGIGFCLSLIENSVLHYGVYSRSCTSPSGEWHRR